MPKSFGRLLSNSYHHIGYFKHVYVKFMLENYKNLKENMKKSGQK
jgi:hypothetical protein